MLDACSRARRALALGTFFTLVAWPATAPAQVEPDSDSAVDALAVAHPDLHVLHDYRQAGQLPALEAGLRAELAALGVAADHGFFDVRGGRWGSLILARPLIPGRGVENTLQWSGGAPADEASLKQAAWSAFLGFISEQQAQLRVDPAEVGQPVVTVHESGRLIQMNAKRVIGGVEVRDSLLMGVINSGNLILYGTRNWGPAGIPVASAPVLSQQAAADIVGAHTKSVGRGTAASEPRLAIVTLESGGDDVSHVTVGQGYVQRLAWALTYRFAGSGGTWEALVDAHDGALLAFTDTNQYADRTVTGGVYPISNDQQSPNGIPDGVEQADWPMPFADLAQPFGTSTTTNSSGIAEGVGNSLSTTLAGPFVRMNDLCGPINEVAVCSNIDVGSGPGTDCTVPQPGVSSPGNTHSSRTGFYEVNRIKELARGWLPTNPWLQDQITSNMNIPNACNAFWDGSTINFYRQSPEAATGTRCRNTGEIPAVFDHEWGHGMDDNDALPDISRPGEAPADIYAITRLNDSCIGRGFFISNSRRADRAGLCDGFGDLCTACSGVRDADWTKRASGLPHDIAWIMKPVVSPGVPGLVPPGGCVGADTRIPAALIQAGPCGQGTHCEGSVVTEVVWDLIARDLNAVFGLDRSTSLSLVARLHYLGGGNVNLWYQCNPALGGCIADGGYLSYLAADDDNGSLLDGTPHMTAIHAAFARHQMACAVPLPVNGGCAGAPAAPSATATAQPRGARVSWNAVAGAQEYWVYRADGLHGCDFGKERVAITTGTEFVDSGLLDGRNYFYAVEAVGGSGSCRSPASACAAVVPQPPVAEARPSLAFRGNESFAVLTGDGDDFVDNCEKVRVRFQVENAGTIDLHNVRIVSVESTPPGTQVLTPLPAILAGTLPVGTCPGGGLSASVDLLPGGLAHNDTLELKVAVTADELPVPLVGTLRIGETESDFVFAASRTFSFETGFDGWRMVSGTYTRKSPGANLTETHLASSEFTAGQCDRIQSPQVRLGSSSTLSLFNQFNTEPGDDTIGFYDRANVGLFDVVDGSRATVSPDGGLRPYNASGAHGACVTEGQPGWAGAGPGFLPSTWSSSALGTADRAGRRLRLDVAYGTDPLVEGQGFQFDEVTLTNADIQSPDAAGDVCAQPPPCGQVDDDDPAVEYSKGWHRRTDPNASGGGYHQRVGKASGSFARLVFTGEQVTYLYAKSEAGGTAEILIDGQSKGTVSYALAGVSAKRPSFGHFSAYSGLGPGSHELVIRPSSGVVYVDGFGVPCNEGGSIDASAARSGSVTQHHSASGSEGPIIERTVTVAAGDLDLSVVVEGGTVPLSVSLLDAAGATIASGEALVPGLAFSGLDLAAPAAGTYTVRVLNTLGAAATIEISTARTVPR